MTIPKTAIVQTDKKLVNRTDSPVKIKRSESKSPSKKVKNLMAEAEMASFLSPAVAEKIEPEYSRTEENLKQKSI